MLRTTLLFWRTTELGLQKFVTVNSRGKVPIDLKSLDRVSVQKYVPRGTLNVGLKLRLIVCAILEVKILTNPVATASVTAASMRGSVGTAPDSS